MSTNIQELDVVALTTDLPSNGLLRGQVGTVVHQYSPEAFEVEFVNQEGQTYALLTLKQDQLLRLQFDPATAA